MFKGSCEYIIYQNCPLSKNVYKSSYNPYKTLQTNKFQYIKSNENY